MIPLTRAWSDRHTLLDVLAAAPDPADARTPLRAAIRRIVEGVWCLFLAEGQDRLAAVQVWFHGGAHRDYLIYHRRGHGNASVTREDQSWVTSVEFESTAGEFDLRRPDHAAELERVLAPSLAQVHAQSLAKAPLAVKSPQADLAKALAGNLTPPPARARRRKKESS